MPVILRIAKPANIAKEMTAVTIQVNPLLASDLLQPIFEKQPEIALNGQLITHRGLKN